MFSTGAISIVATLLRW